MVVWVEFCSARASLDFHDSCKLWLPFVTIFDQLLLVVKKLLVKECGVLVVGTLDNSIDGAGLLAETAENALGHVDVVLGRAARSVRSRLRLDRDCKGRAGRLAKLASDASLLTSWVSTQGVLATEHGTQRTLLPRVVDDVL